MHEGIHASNSEGFQSHASLLRQSQEPPITQSFGRHYDFWKKRSAVCFSSSQDPAISSALPLLQGPAEHSPTSNLKLLFENQKAPQASLPKASAKLEATDRAQAVETRKCRAGALWGLYIDKLKLPSRASSESQHFVKSIPKVSCFSASQASSLAFQPYKHSEIARIAFKATEDLS